MLAVTLMLRPLLVCRKLHKRRLAGCRLADGRLNLARTTGPLMAVAMAIALLLVGALVSLPPFDPRTFDALRKLLFVSARLLDVLLVWPGLAMPLHSRPLNLLRRRLLDPRLLDPRLLLRSLGTRLFALFSPRLLLTLFGASGAALGPSFAILRYCRDRNPDQRSRQYQSTHYHLHSTLGKLVGPWR